MELPPISVFRRCRSWKMRGRWQRRAPVITTPKKSGPTVCQPVVSVGCAGEGAPSGVGAGGEGQTGTSPFQAPTAFCQTCQPRAPSIASRSHVSTSNRHKMAVRACIATSYCQ